MQTLFDFIISAKSTDISFVKVNNSEYAKAKIHYAYLTDIKLKYSPSIGYNMFAIYFNVLLFNN